MTLGDFRSAMDEVIRDHGTDLAVVLIDENDSGIVRVVELDAGVMTVNGKIVFAFIAAGLEGSTQMLQ